MDFPPDAIEHLAKLARIRLSEDEIAAARVQLAGILGLVEELRAVDTSGIEPMTHPALGAGEAALRLREDRVTETDRRELYQSVAPRVEQGLYLVPKVIE